MQNLSEATISTIATLYYIALLPIVLFFVTLLHELGHAMTARIFLGDKDWTIHIGTGKKILQFGKFTINACFFWFGRCYTSKNLEEEKALNRLMFTLGGVFVNILLAIAVFVLGRMLGAHLYATGQLVRIFFWINTPASIFFITNLIQIAACLIPQTYKTTGIKSDGWWMISIIKEMRSSKKS
ncbi:MAG: hypothetical protein FWE21_01865 [Defluviitaleaceae bacterium]|nr:hypothetical protein [Defluviitaleaceae bacterium]